MAKTVKNKRHRTNRYKYLIEFPCIYNCIMFYQDMIVVSAPFDSLLFETSYSIRSNSLKFLAVIADLMYFFYSDEITVEEFLSMAVSLCAEKYEKLRSVIYYERHN
jgi:hypothetical protein